MWFVNVSLLGKVTTGIWVFLIRGVGDCIRPWVPSFLFLGMVPKLVRQSLPILLERGILTMAGFLSLLVYDRGFFRPHIRLNLELPIWQGRASWLVLETMKC